MKTYKNIQCQYIYGMKLWKGSNTCRYQTNIEFLKILCEGPNKNSRKGICRFGEINHLGNEREIKYFIDGQDMKQYHVLIFRCIA